MKEIATEATERSVPAQDVLRLVIGTATALIHTGRPDGYLDYFNQRWLEFLGLPLEEVCGWRWTGAVHPEDVAGLLQKWHAALGSGEPLEAEARVRRADGEYRLLLHRKVPLRNERGAILKWYGSSVDIEGQRQAQERILRDERERLSATPPNIGRRSCSRFLGSSRRKDIHGICRSTRLTYTRMTASGSCEKQKRFSRKVKPMSTTIASSDPMVKYG